MHQVKENLDSKLAIGISKHQDKIDGIKTSKIYSWSTYKTYLKHCCYFVKWCKNKDFIIATLGHNPRKLEDCKPFISQWLSDRIKNNISPFTLHMELSALVKLYDISVKDVDIQLPERNRGIIKRSRTTSVRDSHFSTKNNADLITFCKCTGLRRSELQSLRGNSLIEKDGKYFLDIKLGTKGGRPRVCPIVGTEDEVRLVIDKMRTAGSNKVWGKVNSNADIHSYRADYATKIYKLAERDSSDIKDERMIIYKNRIVKTYFTPNGKPNYLDNKGFYDFSKKDKYGNPVIKPGFKDKPRLYICRKDMRKKYYDRHALFTASLALGHNRETVVAEYYIR